MDRLEEEGAIKLYHQIIEAARNAGDSVTENLFASACELD